MRRIATNRLEVLVSRFLRQKKRRSDPRLFNTWVLSRIQRKNWIYTKNKPFKGNNVSYSYDAQTHINVQKVQTSTAFLRDKTLTICTRVFYMPIPRPDLRVFYFYFTENAGSKVERKNNDS